MSEFKNNGEDKDNCDQTNIILPKIVQFNIEITDTLELTQEFNENFFTPFHIENKKSNRLRNINRFNEDWFENTRKSIYITQFIIMKHDIKNYRPLTEIQISQLDTLTEEEKTEIIKIYNTMFSSYKQNVIV